MQQSNRVGKRQTRHHELRSPPPHARRSDDPPSPAPTIGRSRSTCPPWRSPAAARGGGYPRARERWGPLSPPPCRWGTWATPCQWQRRAGTRGAGKGWWAVRKVSWPIGCTLASAWGPTVTGRRPMRACHVTDFFCETRLMHLGCDAPRFLSPPACCVSPCCPYPIPNCGCPCRPMD